MIGNGTETEKTLKIIKQGAESSMTDKQFIEKEIAKFKCSPVRRDMLAGEKYYRGEHDISKRKRTVIGEGGKLTEVYNLPNNRLIDNQYGKLVDQKNNYLLSKPITFNCDNKSYADTLNKIFDSRFLRLIKNIGEDCLNGGIGWMYVYYNEKSELSFQRFKPYEVLPFWKDADHTELDLLVRLYEIEAYEGYAEKIIEKVEVFSSKGIERYTLESSRLIPDSSEPYMAKEGEGLFNWDKIPVIAFKQNNKEIPLIKRVKSLQDALNTVRSDFMNNMQEDSRNTILVLKNYDGENLGEFRRNLSEYGAVKVSNIDGSNGGVESLKVEVNSNNYIVLCDMLKKAIIENARGYDARDERMSNNPNQMNIQSMYSDIDLDANSMETEFKASFEELLWFINIHLSNSGKRSFENENIEIIFNRDQLINETEAINNCKASIGILSDDTIVSQHPWTIDVEKELKKLEEQEEKNNPIYNSDNYSETFKHLKAGGAVEE